MTIADKLKKWGLLRSVVRAFRRLARPQRFLVWHTPRRKLEAQLIGEALERGGAMIDIGSGTRRLHPRFINLDIEPNREVDLLGDAEALPFGNDCFDLVWIEAVLEHLPNPSIAVTECRRVLKPGGCIYAEIPFLQGYHAAPNDYQRLTLSGLRHLFREFEIIQAEPCSGPGSTFAYAGCALFAALFSFGSPWLHKIAFHYIFCYIFFPFKYLDRFLIRFPNAGNTAFGHSLLARKRMTHSTVAEEGEQA